MSQETGRRQQDDTPSGATTAQETNPNNVEDGENGRHLTSKLEYVDEVQLSDFIGEHGFYQLALSVLLFVRYVLLGLMANSGPLMTPDVTFYCHLPMQEILLIMPNISMLSPREQELEIKEEFKQVCQIDLHLYQNQSQLMSNSSKWLPGQSFKTSPIKASSSSLSVQTGLVEQSIGTVTNQSISSIMLDYHQGTYQKYSNNNALQQRVPNVSSQQPPNRIRECTEFTYQLAPNQGRTVTSEFNLVCDDDWLRSLFQSLLSAAIVVAHVFWGTFSDKYGRFQAQRICLVISLLAGTLSIFAWDFWSFTLLRALCSFGDLGLVVSMTTTMVELVGNKYRGLSVALVNFGYALGVSLLPYLVAYCQDFRLMIGVTVLCHMITMPFVLATNESIRWLLTNRKHKPARRELKRIMRWNHNCSEIWPGSYRWIMRCCNRSYVRGSKQEDLSGHHKSSANELLEQRREFQLKFEKFIKQFECQNLCDPNTSEPEQASGPVRPSMVADTAIATTTTTNGTTTSNIRQLQLRPAAPSSRFDSLLRPQLPTSDNQPENQSAITMAEIHPEIKPRVLNMVDFENLQLIKEVESAVQQVTGGNGLGAARSRPLSRGRFFDDSAIKSMSLQGPYQLASSSRWSLQDQEQQRNRLMGPTRHAHIRQRQQQCQPDCINMFAHQLSFVGRVSCLFKDKKLMIATFTIVWTTFNSELLYTSFIIINLYAGEDVYLNYVIGGCAEALAAIVASLLLSYSPRRLSLIAFWLLISFSCFALSLAHIDNIWAVWLLALAKFSQSCLSSIASVAAYESFPTFLRQSGSGLVFTLGMMGSVFAPLIFAEFDDHAGMDRVLIIFSISSLTAAFLIYMFLKETRDCELM